MLIWVGENSITGLNVISDTFEKVDLIWKRLLTSQSQQKSYADRRRQPLYFEVGTVAYRLALPPSLSGVYEVFHVSMLRKYTLDPAHVVDLGEITVDTDGTFEEGPMHILDSRDQVL